MNSLDYLITRYLSLKGCKDNISRVCEELIRSFESGGRLYVCGNGGSAADALHMVGELVKSFVLQRTLDRDVAEQLEDEIASKLQGALPAYALVENVALTSAYANDVDSEYIFAQQVYAYARKGDCVMGISTSGNSKNVLQALKVARARGAVTLGLTGRDGGEMKDICDVCIIVPEIETYKIQELHLPIYHTICIMLEEHFWGNK